MAIAPGDPEKTVVKENISGMQTKINKMNEISKWIKLNVIRMHLYVNIWYTDISGN